MQRSSSLQSSSLSSGRRNFKGPDLLCKYNHLWRTLSTPLRIRRSFSLSNFKLLVDGGRSNKFSMSDMGISINQNILVISMQINNHMMKNINI